MIERALRAEADGKGITMTILAKSIPKPKLPRWHSETRRENVCDFSKRNTGSFRGILVYTPRMRLNEAAIEKQEFKIKKEIESRS